MLAPQTMDAPASIGKGVDTCSLEMLKIVYFAANVV